jgi:hypothetical protein
MHGFVTSCREDPSATFIGFVTQRRGDTQRLQNRKKVVNAGSTLMALCAAFIDCKRECWLLLSLADGS